MGKKVMLTLTDDQVRMLRELVGPMGSSIAEVARNIIIAYLSEKSFIKDTWAKKSG